MWMGISAGAVILCPTLLLMTGLPLFTWLTVLAVLGLAATAIAAWRSGQGRSKRDDTTS
jgi:membrane protein implicated in regulation of membrane protease activity